jgi:tRNA A37 methylthiotransferase MiaB
VARRRWERLLAAQRPIALAARQRLVGRRMRVLVEGVHEETEHLLVGRHHGQAPEIDGRVLINDGLAPAGALAEIEITAAYADDLVGRVVGPIGAPGVHPATGPEVDQAVDQPPGQPADRPAAGVPA